jgi:aminoglycoside phosphotransferase (APT) family kinase protein
VDAWSSPEWPREATEWLDARLDESGIARTGEVELFHSRPWATVLRAPTSQGDVWLKASGPETAFEAGLYRVLAEVVADSVPRPIAIDAERGWLLLEDGGPTLASAAQATPGLERAVAAYARLQRRIAPRARELLAIGVPDMRAEAMPARFDEALAAVSGYVEKAGSAAEETYARLEDLRPTYASWCERLAETPGTASVDHNDLHPENILIGEGGAVRFYDWGDAVVAHPFASMMLPLGYAQEHLGDATVTRVRDAYLSEFDDLAPHDELVATLERARTVAKVARALTWKRALAAAGPEGLDRYGDAPLRALASIFEGPYLWG